MYTIGDGAWAVIYLLITLAFILLALILLSRSDRWTDLKAEFHEMVRDIRAGLQGAVRTARTDIRRAEGARNPVGPPVDAEEAASFVAAYRRLSRPALLLRPDVTAEAPPSGASLGGPAWFAPGEEWPRNPAGQPLQFIAQLDFARLPRLDRFPAHGVARFFVGRDDLWGVDFDAPDRSDVRVLWHEGPQAGGRYEPAVPLMPNEYSPFQHETVRTTGVALRAEPIEDLPDFYSWQLQELLEPHAGEGMQAVEDRLSAVADARAVGHRIGGHPTFTQYDFRKRGDHDDLDVVLLGVTSDDTIMWGDMGEAVFLVRAADLERRDFTRVAFYWDCH